MSKSKYIHWIAFFSITFICSCSNSEFPTTTGFSDALISLDSDTLSIPIDSSEIKADSSITKKDSSKVIKDSTTIKSDSSKGKNDSASVKSDSSRVKNDSASVKSDSSKTSKDSIENKSTSSDESTPLLPQAGFKQAFTLTPPSTQNIVRCTFDGTEPDTNSQIFTNEKIIDTTTVVRCTEFKNGKVSRQQTETYFINENIAMPIVSISVAPNYLQDYLDAKPCSPDPCANAKFWEDVEYPVHVEYFAEGTSSKEKAFEINAGISIAGNYSRNQEKKSVSITMRKEYQAGRINYPLFKDRPENSTFKSFTLRNNGNRFISDYIADAMATSLLEGTNVDYQRSRQVIVFYNGIYHGIYDMREKLNEHFVENNHNINHDDVDFIKINSNLIETKNGSSDDYFSLMRFVESTDFENNNSAYESISKRIDIVNFIEYMAAETYYHNGDWPHNNIRAWKTSYLPWKFIAFDIDQGFDWTWNVKGFSQGTNMITWIINGGKTQSSCSNGNDYRCFPNIFAKLIKNNDFKQAFINRASYLYSTFINAKKIKQKIDYINSTIDPSQIARDIKMYNRTNYKNACGTNFETDGSCLKTWSTNRDKTVRTDFKESFGLSDEIPITINIKGNGLIKLDGFDIKQSSTYNWDVFENHPMKLSITCPNGTKFKTWENGSTEPDRIIEPIAHSVYTAECQ